MCAKPAVITKLNFDATKVEPQKPLEPVPTDWYPVIIVSSEVKPTTTSPKDGTRLALEVEIIDGEYKGHKAFDGINITNKNPVAADIGQRQLSAICHATGALVIKDSKELHNKPFLLRLGYEEARIDPQTKKSYDARNVFKAFKPMEGATPGVASSSATAPDWAKKKPGLANAQAVAGTTEPEAPAEPETPPETQPEAAAGEPDARLFWVVIDGESVEKTGDDIIGMLADGMPVDTPVMLQDETDWQTAADYGLAAPDTAPAAPTPPPVPSKPKAPAKPAAPAAKIAAPAAKTAAPAGNTPPWKKK